MIKSQEKSRLLFASGLIAATGMGIAYFWTPVLMGIAGFLPALVMMLLVWAIALAISFLYAEVVLGYPEGFNLPSLTREVLGKSWKVVLSSLFLLLLLSHQTALLFFGAKFSQWFFYYKFNLHVTEPWVLLGLATLFALLVATGFSFAARIHFLLMVGFLLSLGTTFFLGADAILLERLAYQHWSFAFLLLPTLFASWSYFSILPPICSYLNRRPKTICRALWLGSLLSLLIYLLWHAFMLSSLSSETYWILYKKKLEIEEVIALTKHFPHLAYLFNFIFFFSTTTTLLATALASVDFLADLFLPKARHVGVKRLLLCLFNFSLPCLFSLLWPHLFLTLLQRFFSLIGGLLLGGIIPLWMASKTRYRLKLSTPPLLFGGRPLFVLLAILLCILVYLASIDWLRG